jgi:ribosomal protein S18 acetylase RimI-like enzyme
MMDCGGGPAAPIEAKEVQLRPVTAADESFLLALFSEIRRPALAVTGWTDADQDAFLASQFALQSKAYSLGFPSGEFHLITWQGRPIGRLYFAQLPDEIRVVDLALIAPFRGQGIGTHLLRMIVSRADSAGLKVRFHVEIRNPARRLYERLGFKLVLEHGPYLLMERPVQTQLNEIQ